MTFGLIETTTYGDGGADAITALGGSDTIFGGHQGDAIDAGDGDNIVFRVLGVLPFIMLMLMTVFEVLVGFLQAYIFTILTAVYIGSSAHPEH